MNASERLQAIIKERREWESFGWGPLLTAWAFILVAKTVVELVTGPRWEIGTGAYFLVLAAQAVAAFGPRTRSGTRQPEMHGLWALVAVSAWFFGSCAPNLGSVTVQAASVLEFMFLAGGLTITGTLKGRRSLFIGGVALAVSAVLLSIFPVLWSWRPLLVAFTFGAAALTTLAADRKPSPRR